jgi:hypothetical protein
MLLVNVRGHLNGAAQKQLTGAGVATAAAIFGFAFSAVTFGAVSPADASPSYARQTGQPCGTCHTDFPGLTLTPYGRKFKLLGYNVGQEQEEAVRRAQEQLELQRAEARRQQRDLEDRARAGGYQSISVEAFVLDGKDLATSAAKVSLSGVYIRQGNLDVLYANVQAAMIANSRGLHQPNVPLLTDDASREFRHHLLMCQSNPASAEMGCSVTVLGRVATCKLSNAFGATREEPCVAVENGK